MRHSKPVRLETAPTKGKSVYLFLEFTISYKEVLLESIASIVFDRNLLSPFSPTYALPNVNAP